MRRWLAAAVSLVCAVSWYALLPALPATTAPSAAAAPVRGAIHVHTRRSDGTGTVDDVAAAAARAGLQFVIITDHGDATPGPDTPVYRQGVLCIDAVEISTDGGHIVALDLPQAPFPLAGAAADVLDDIHRFGGMSIVAHPDSSRGGLTWSDWGTSFDGLEWLNGDSQWRDESWPSLARSLITYPIRRAATLASLLDRPDELLGQWDRLARERPIVALAASDAHARIGPGGDPYPQSLGLHVPSYEQVFSTFSISLPQVQLAGDAERDARVVIDAIRAGRVYSTIDALAGPGTIEISAKSGLHRATMGERLTVDGPVTLHVSTNAPTGSTIRLIAGGHPVASGPPPALEYAAPSAPGMYRVEVALPGAPGNPPVPWILSNPVYVGTAASPAAPPEPPPVVDSRSVYDAGEPAGWRVEKNARSEGAISVVKAVDDTQVLFRYGLGGTMSESPYIAVAVPAGPLAGFDRVMFTARAVRPMRVSFQVRAASAGIDRRWIRSVYLDEHGQTVTVPLTSMRPVGDASGSPVAEEISDLLFVVDTVNTKLGSSGQIWVDEIKYVR